jgi:hypothetical protein
MPKPAILAKGAEGMEYRPQSALETVHLIVGGKDPWLAFGQFLDNWRRTTGTSERAALVAEAPPAVLAEYVRWTALVAAAVDLLCAQENLAPPPWVQRPEYRLPEPWFLYPGWRLRAWQLVETPVAFRSRNIFGGDRILSRV